MIEDPWWATCLGFIPVAGDAFDLARTPIQIRKAIKKADRLQEKIDKLLHIQHKKARELIRGSFKGEGNELMEKTYIKLHDLADGGGHSPKKPERYENLLKKNSVFWIKVCH